MYPAFFAIGFHPGAFVISDLVTNTVAITVVLGIMILVHEFGHYAAAKLLGVRVEVFSIGFGKRLVGFKRGDTDYRISALPLGGYVKMTGENPTDTHTGDKSEFTSHPRWHRFLIAIAGPAMNILFAVVLLTGAYMVRYPRSAYLDGPAVIGNVEDGTPAAKAGLKVGDVIVQVGDRQNPTWEQLDFAVGFSPNHSLDLKVKRGDEVFPMSITPAAVGKDQIGRIGIDAARPIYIEQVEPGMPAAKVGIKPGDTIEAINGDRIYSIDELLSYLKKNETKPVEVTVLRNGQLLPFQTAPVRDNEGRYRLGFKPGDPQNVVKLPFDKALAASLEENKKLSLLIVELVEKLVRGIVPMRQISGPIGMAAAVGQTLRQPDWGPTLVYLMAAISLNLGIFNLFPIPIMDGGLILLLGIEGLMRRDISQPIKERIYQAAFVFLVLFAAVVIYNDIAKSLIG